jgi:DNA-binding NarL/FixJ family response regulator
MSTPEETNPDLPIKVFLAEDHELFRTQLAKLIERNPRFVICGGADNIKDCLLMIETAHPQLVIVDITLKGGSGLELVKGIKARAEQTMALVLSMHDESMYAERALKAGASGYITKHKTPEQLMAAIECVLNGGVYLSTRMTTELLGQLSAITPESSKEDITSLSHRELEIFHLLEKGLSPREIANELHLGEKTVYSYRLHIKAKLGIKHSGELYSFAALARKDAQPGTQTPTESELRTPCPSPPISRSPHEPFNSTGNKRPKRFISLNNERGQRY